MCGTVTDVDSKLDFLVGNGVIRNGVTDGFDRKLWRRLFVNSGVSTRMAGVNCSRVLCQRGASCAPASVRRQIYADAFAMGRSPSSAHKMTVSTSSDAVSGSSASVMNRTAL